MVKQDSPISLKQQVVRHILELIEKGELNDDHRIEPELEMAKRFSISRVTVRQAILELVNKGVLYRVQGKGTFVVGKGDLETSTGQVNSSIALIVPYLQDIFMAHIMDGVKEVCANHGYQLLLATSNNDLTEEARLINEYRKQQVTGFIIFPVGGSYYNDEILSLYLDKIPLVLVDRYYRHLKLDYVVSNNDQGAYSAVSHLLGLGHRQIAFVSHQIDGTTSLEDRFNGYCRAMNDFGCVIDPKLVLDDVHVAQDSYSTQFNYGDMEKTDWVELFDKNHMPTAIFASTDIIAVDLMRFLKSKGYRIPDDISIVGFDNTEWIAYLDPPLDSVSQEKRLVGEHASLMLINRIVQPNSPHSTLQVPTKLIIRESSAGLIQRE